jgi:hypothetical protein
MTPCTKPSPEPPRDERGLAADHGLEQRERRAPRLVREARGSAARARSDELGQQASSRVRGEVLEGADAQVARRDAREHRARQAVSAQHELARRHRRERARRGHTERVHRLAHAGSSRSTGPSAARPSPPRENGVGPEPLSCTSRRTPSRPSDLAEQHGAAVAELRDEVAELVPRVGERDRLGSRGAAGCRRARATPSGDRSSASASMPQELGERLGSTREQRRRLDRRRARSVREEALGRGARSCCRTRSSSCPMDMGPNRRDVPARSAPSGSVHCGVRRP